MGSAAAVAIEVAVEKASRNDLQSVLFGLSAESLEKLSTAIAEPAQLAQPDVPKTVSIVCRICLEPVDVAPGPQCACRGSASFAHLHCLIKVAESKQTIEAWRRCTVCKECYVGPTRLNLARAMWDKYGSMPDDHPAHMAAADMLMTALQETGHRAEAARMLRENYARLKEQLGEKHMRTLVAANNLANALESPFEKASLMQEAVASASPVFGAEHELTLGMTYTWATAIKDCGRYEDATRLFEQTLQIMITRLGADHEYTLACTAELALSLHKSGNNARALGMLKQQVVDSKRVFGPEHPNTLDVQESLGSVLLAEGSTAEAKDLLSNTFQASKRVQGPDHPNTLKCSLSLARALHKQNCSTNALEILISTLDSMKRVLGNEDCTTMCCARELGIVLKETGVTDKGVELLGATLKTMTSQLGAEHPETLMCSKALA